MQNLSIGKSITSDVNHFQNFIPENAIDGNLSNGYLVSTNGVVANLTIDLGHKCRIVNVELTNLIYSSIYRTRDFDVYASKDGVNYSLILSGTLPNNSSEHTFENPNKKDVFRYVRLSIKSHYGSSFSDNSVGIGEIKINGYNGFSLLKSNNKIYSLQSEEALYKLNMTSNTNPTPYVASASSVVSATYPAWKAFNGVTLSNSASNNFWGSDENKIPAWISIDFGGTKDVNFVDIYLLLDGSQSARIKDFTIQGSNDGSTWNNLKSFSNEKWENYTNKRFYLSKTFSYRHYRLYITALNGHTRTNIVELVYGVEQELIQLPSDSVENFKNYGRLSIQNFNSIKKNKEYVLQDTVSENTDGLWVQEIDRKPLSIKFE